MTVTAWPGVAALRDEFAQGVVTAMTVCRTRTGYSREETIRQAESATRDIVDEIATAMIEAAEGAICVWKVTQ